MRLALLGFGLIGGSIARAIRANPTAGIGSIVAWSPSGRGPQAALAQNVIDAAAGSLEEAVEGAELVVLAADPLACLDLLDQVAPLANRDDSITISDVASTKAALGRRADTLGLAFVGGHPMAGLESTGYENSRADLFAGRPWVLCPGRYARPADLGRVEQLVRACGAEGLQLVADEHDRAVAAISHMPLAVAAALVDSVRDRADWELAQRLAAGGWLSATRLALGDPRMGAGIAATNLADLAVRLRALRSQLNEWLEDLEETPDDPAATAARIERRLAAARQALVQGG
jgi:prephenate dehydrogenase